MMDVDKVKNWLKVGLLLLSLVVVGNLWWNVRGLLRDLRGATENLRNTSKEFNDYWVAQRQVLESTKNQKAVEAALAVGATYQATGRLINTQVIPAILRQLEAGTLTTHKLLEVADEARGMASAGKALVSGVEKEVNSQLLPEITAGVQELNKLARMVERLAEGTGASVQEVIGALNHLVAMGDVTVQTVNQRLADPKLDELLAAAVGTVQHTQGVATSLDIAAAEIPPIVKSARKWQGPLRWAQLIATLASILRP